jgi:pimeloyl-ACP methyl ester carboxylesterase
MHTITSADGTTLAAEQTGSGPAVVLVGGAFNDRGTVAGLARALAPDRTAWTYDRRGRGASGPLGPWPGRAEAVRREIEDLAAVVAATGASVAVVGHSSGAILALEAAAAGVPMRAVVAYEPPYVLPGTRPVAGADLADRLVAAEPADAVALFLTEGVGVPAEMVAMIAGSPDYPGMVAIAPTLAYDTAICGPGSALPAERLGRISVPALVLDGGDSPEWMRAAAAAAAAAIPGAAYETVPGEDHAILQRPEVFAAALRQSSVT